MKIWSNFDQPLRLNCDQMGIKVVIPIKYVLNNIVWIKIRHLRHFVQNLVGVKVQSSCKISKFCYLFEATKTHINKMFGIWIFFYLKRQVCRYYQEKNQVGLTSSYINLTMKLFIKLCRLTKRHGVTRKRCTKRLKHTGNLFRKNLQNRCLLILDLKPFRL